MRALVTGATGFIGRALLQRLDHPIILTRNPDRARQQLPGVEAWIWHPPERAVCPEAFRDIRAIFHLAGESIAGARWNEAQKKRIRDSRVDGTRNLLSTLEVLPVRPAVLVCASAIGYYGDRADAVLDEQAPPGSDFLANVCREWEAEADRARGLGMRVVSVRIGVVLGKGGGALARMVPVFRAGLGGRLGSGRQWMSWIHIDDLITVLLKAAEDTRLAGPLNAVAPQPVRNADFTRALASALGRPAFLPAPRLALRLALGEVASSLLGSQRVVPKRLLEAGYTFLYPELGAALKQIVGN